MKKLSKILLLIFIVFIVLFVIFKLWIKNNLFKEQIPVLMYHDVLYDEYYENKPDTVSFSMLEQQFKYLHDNNIKTLTLDEFYCWKKGNCKYDENSVLLTFDDGFYSFHYLVEPLLEKYDLHATCFLIGNTIKDITPEYDPENYGTIGIDLINNHSSYVEYQSHSYGMHKYINGKQKIYSMTREEIQEDLDNMKSLLDAKYVSYPFNTDTDLFIEKLKDNGYKLAFRGEAEKAVKSNNEYQIPRIGVDNDMKKIKKIFETKKFNNRYGNGLLRKVFITIERKLKLRLG